MILLVCDLNVRSTPNFVVQKATLTEEKQNSSHAVMICRLKEM